MKARDFFPLGIAEGKAFCNRKKETKWLLGNIESGKHSLLISPRRYGKTSLAYRAIDISKLANVQIDFAMATNDQKIESLIVNGVTTLIGKAIGPVDKIINLIKKYVAKVTPKIAIKAGHVSLELDFPSTSDSAVNVMEALLLLENLLAEKKQRAIILFDEFQAVGVIAKGKGIEGAIRNVAQKTKYLTIIFSGSNRKLLKSMFDDNTRPLYKLCKQLTLERIGYEDYKSHLTKASLAAWSTVIDEEVINNITTLSESHPYYINKLCDIIWSEYTHPPKVNDISKAWKLLLAEEKSDILKELSLLSLGQKKILAIIAQGITSNLASKSILIKADMSPSSISTTLQTLIEKDVLEQKHGQYHIINPALKDIVFEHDGQ